MKDILKIGLLRLSTIHTFHQKIDLNIIPMPSRQIKQIQVKTKFAPIRQPVLQTIAISSSFMKQTPTQPDSNEQDREKTYTRLLELYYNSNINLYSNLVKKCIPDLESNPDQRLIKKTDKIWVQANLQKIYFKASEKLQKLLLAKNQQIKNTIDQYRTQLQSLPLNIIYQIRSSTSQRKSSVSEDSKNKKKCNPIQIRNQSFFIQNVNSQPSQNQINSRKTLSSKRMFRVRQYKTNLQQMISNTRYVQKLEKVKLQSTFASVFFPKEQNPEQVKFAEFSDFYLNKIKALTNIRWNLQSFQKATIIQDTVGRGSEKDTKHLGFQLRKQSLYKPKSKCQGRRNKIFVNF